MKKHLIFIFFIVLFGCNENYESNNKINDRKPPIVIVALDTTNNAVVMRDGDNNIFTIYNTPTSKAINHSLCVKDTLRVKSGKYFNINF